jgi:hypothetical protein
MIAMVRKNTNVKNEMIGLNKIRKMSTKKSSRVSEITRIEFPTNLTNSAWDPTSIAVYIRSLFCFFNQP